MIPCFSWWAPQTEVELAITMVAAIIVGLAWLIGKLWIAATTGPPYRAVEMPEDDPRE